MKVAGFWTRLSVPVILFIDGIGGVGVDRS